MHYSTLTGQMHAVFKTVVYEQLLIQYASSLKCTTDANSYFFNAIQMPCPPQSQAMTKMLKDENN
jgi:hypothetical protein